MRHAPRPLPSLVGGIVVVAWVMPEIVAAFACHAFFSSDGTLNALLGAVHLLIFSAYVMLMFEG